MKKVILFICLLNTYCLAQLKQGIYSAEFQLNDSTVLPFRFEVKGTSLEVINGEERIAADSVFTRGDSVFIRMALFDSEIRCRLKGDSLAGNFFNHARTANNVVPFRAAYGDRIPLVNSFELKDFKGRWEVSFAGDDPPINKAVGEFAQTGNHITGTFLTPTGDYRFLEGYADGDFMYLSCFDGSHLFYFNARMDEKENLSGHYYSGRHWHDTWTAFRNDKAALPDPDTLTYLKKGYDKLDFSFPDTDSNLVSLSDKRFNGKVVLVQIMGTWCPNCMDETAFLAPFYKEFQSKGLEIIGLDYEKIPVFATARKNLNRLKKHYAIGYPLLYAGSTDVAKREQTLPMLNSILAFPTTIYIDRKGRVRKIHTGFSGPATGEHFERWKEEFYSFINKLLAE